jgi:hypothetical protein
MKYCSNCTWLQNGLCKFNPPTALMHCRLDGVYEVLSYYPTVNNTDTCHNHFEKNPAIPTLLSEDSKS